MKKGFILASESPRRRELLTALGLDFSTVASGVDEKYSKGESPEEHVLRLSREKAGAVSRRYPGNWVLGADTIVLIDEDILGKPEKRDDARMMLRKLAGREHTVITGFALTEGRAGKMMNKAVSSSVLFKEIPEDEIEWYTATEEPYDKAGGYAVQGRAAFFIKEIRGSHTNVIGLPLCEVVDALKTARIISFDKE